jgi:ATP-dependent helicase HrpB
MHLPVDDALPELLGTLRDQGRALLIAPPGAGKTTRVPPALLSEPWCEGRVLLLVPRRLAARAAAEFMANAAGEEVGRTIGYQTRLDSRVGPGSRIVAMTHGVFLSQIQNHPELRGVSAVLFDEIHERSLDSDLALALTLDAAHAFRPDLRLLAMSATLDGTRIGRALGDAPMIRCEGKAHPLEVRHLGRDASLSIERQVAAACRQALADNRTGSVLAFLPGTAEIERTADAIGQLPADVILHKLHGSVEPALQRAAIAAPPEGKRKLVLATNIAETSLTLEDVRIVIDSGLVRRPRYDRGAGLTRLVTERVSRASATQRAGRAARQAPGLALRLWEQAATAALPEHEPPEILEGDLSALLLACLRWGERDPTRLRWADPPPAAALQEARQRLEQLGAVDPGGLITAHGQAIARLPLDPRLAHMLLESASRGCAAVAAEAALLLSERGLGGNDPDLEVRLRRWRSDRSPRAEAARRLAARLRRLAETEAASPKTAPRPTEGFELACAIALAFPERAARRRDGRGETWQSVGGRGFRLDPASSLAGSQWLAVAEVSGQASGARILAAAAIEEEQLLSLFADRVEEVRRCDFDPQPEAYRPAAAAAWERSNCPPGQTRRRTRRRSPARCSPASASMASACCRGHPPAKRSGSVPPSPGNTTRPYRRSTTLRFSPALKTGCRPLWPAIAALAISRAIGFCGC